MSWKCGPDRTQRPLKRTEILTFMIVPPLTFSPLFHEHGVWYISLNSSHRVPTNGEPFFQLATTCSVRIGSRLSVELRPNGIMSLRAVIPAQSLIITHSLPAPVGVCIGALFQLAYISVFALVKQNYELLWCETAKALRTRACVSMQACIYVSRIQKDFFVLLCAIRNVDDNHSCTYGATL